MDRRSFLNAGFASLASSATCLVRTAEAAVSDRVLVVLFMRGGWDGLNVVVPHGDDDYYRLRPSIAIPRPQSGAAYSALDLDGFFGFHPSMRVLHDLYVRGMVAVLPAVQYGAASRSHFAGQGIIESAVINNGDDGWLARYLMAAQKDSAVSATSISEQLPRSLFGLQSPPMVIPSLSNLTLAASTSDRPTVEHLINTAYGWTPKGQNPHDETLYRIGRDLKTRLGTLQNAGATYLSPASGYPASTLGRSMNNAAAIIKARLGVEVITLNAGGWDTHGAQGGAQPQGKMAGLLFDFSQSVGAFFNDLGADASRVLLLTATEFGRTAAENGSEGTDHGHASVWMAMGSTVRGGMYLGSGWPGLDAPSLHEGRYLAHTIDFRSIYGDILKDFIGFPNVAAVLPGHAYEPLGLL